MADETPAFSSLDAPARERFIVVLWRRRWVLLSTVLLVTAVTAVVSKSLPKEYEAVATLWVTEDSGTAAFDAVQAGEVLARTYAQVADSPILATRVAERLPWEASGGDVLGAMSFEPVSETQLLRIVGTDGDANRARILANAYAESFIDHSRGQLGETVQSQIAFADRASTPTQAARPQPTLYTLVGALLGLIAGVGLAFLAELLDRRVRSTEELQEIVGVPTLAQVPQRTGAAAAESAFEETFRLLRTNLQFLKRDGELLRSLAVVSPSEGDGKSSVAFNLALSMAEAGQTVVLIEADMRRPGLRRLALPDGPEETPAGLSTYLSAARPDLDEVLHETAHPGLLFLPAGLLPPAPSTLLDAARSRLLLSETTERAAVVIVDTPPLSVGAEAATLAASVDATLMVVDMRISKKAAVRRAHQQLSVVGASLLGLVVNRVKTLSDIGAYAYSYRPDGNGSEEGRSRGARWRQPRERQRQD